MKVLVTGAAGFLGSNFSRLLAERAIPIVGVDNFTHGYDPALKRENAASFLSLPGTELVKGDIRKGALWKKLEGKGITHIVHLAALASVGESTAKPYGYLDNNVAGTLKVLEFAARCGANRVVLASTSSIYGTNEVPFREGMPLSTPLNYYAASKIAMEAVAHAFHHLHGTPMTVLRFFTIYGPGGRPDMVVYRFAEQISGGKPIEVFGDGTARRDYTYVADACEAIFLSLSARHGFAAFNIGNSESHEVKELIPLLEKHLGRKASVKHVADRPEDHLATVSDISLARKELGYEPRVGLEEGIRLFCGWYKAREASRHRR